MRRPRGWDVVAVALAAAAVRLVAYFRQPELTYDGTYYLRQAERLTTGGFEFIGFPPGFPLAAAAVHTVVGDWVTAGRLVSMASGVAIAALTLVWARRRISPAWALAAALAVALHPHHARTSVEVLSEPLYGCVLLAAFLLFERERDGLAGLLCGYAFLIRPEGLAVYAGLVAVRAMRTRRVPVALLGGMVLVAGYAVLASRAVGHPVVTPKQGQLDLGAAVAGRTWTLVRMLHACFPLVLVPGALVWAVRRAPHVVAVFAAAVAAPFFDVHIQERLHFPALPLWIGLGFGWLASLAPSRRRVAGASAAILFLIGAAPGYRLLWNGFELVPHARAIGTALRPHFQAQDRVAGRFPLVPYFAGADFVRAPRDAAYPALMDSIRRHGATHLLVLESEMQNVLPQLRPLFQDAAFVTSDTRLATAAVLESPPGQRAIVYRLSPAPLGDNVEPVAAKARGAAWCGDRLVVAGMDGELRFASGAALAATPEHESEPVPDGEGVVCIQATAGGSWIAAWDPVRGTYETYPTTRADAPRSPAVIGDAIVYVRSVAPIGLAVLDRHTGQVHAVNLQGLESDAAIPRAISARGRDVAVTYARPHDDARRVVATCRWPEVGRGDIELTGRWATSLQLADDAVAWLAEGDAVVASLCIDDAAEKSALCAVHPNGRVRRLSFDFPGARRPALAGARIAFVDPAGTLRAGNWEARAVRLPAVRTFAPNEAPNR